ncbi:MAG: threonine--tRNA ligase [Candidatus Vogelbacteria bacterium RIFOXYD1_FULL_46_19]|uniref:Threonine--tRNA ligase n=1 Tax=Candidatus Vogelbacteria bacterium RIFOXYD1_FULL_46_19 TaxID=1802439 RepID=A0A1G2QG67_9BACT|nr:MAG: threonine--tRNA ligase [Candidatus Vogelbacteria bacterium RIFOXYD1_FULL_46_19]
MTTNSNLEQKRHTLAHLLAAAVLDLYPEAKNTIGPAIDNGFYYDFDLASPISDKDLPKIEARMRELLPDWSHFVSEEVSAAKAKSHYETNPYKQELIDEIVERGEPLTLYTAGDFTDLCRGGHVEAPVTDLDPAGFKLDRVAGAYWRGNETNKMLTRIYGLAFDNQVDLEYYLAIREEAEKRDHKKLGKELGLFIFSDLVGSGLPLWTVKGTLIRELLNDYVWELRQAKNFGRVTIPHITKKDLYETSGHWSKFADELFRITTREGHEFAMKPMNCPHHTQIYAAEQRSYRDLPQRYAETTMVYRDEQSGELAGLSRVRSITQDDAHVFCRENQIEAEINTIWDIIDTFYRTFGFDLQVRFSRHNPAEFDKYLGTPAIWAKAEDKLKTVITDRYGQNFIDGVGEAAMYGPKIDFMAKDALGRILQVATIQLDFNMPERFDLTCINEQGQKEQIVMIHCAIMGSIERFMSTLIEHYAGAFPLWLSPVQVAILPVAEAHDKAASDIAHQLQAEGIRVEALYSGETLGKRLRAVKMQKVPYFIVMGDKEIESGKLTIENRQGDKEELTPKELSEKLHTAINQKLA